MACMPGLMSLSGNMSTFPATGRAISAPCDTPRQATAAIASHLLMECTSRAIIYPLGGWSLRIGNGPDHDDSADEFCQLRAGPNDGLIALGTGRDATDLDTGAVFEKFQIRLSPL